MKRFLALCALALPALATTTLSIVSVTPQQIIAKATTDQAGNCTWRVSEGNSFVTAVNDVNETLFTGSTSDARTGSIISGNDHTFVIGLRLAQQANDGKVYSRSLQAYTSHFVESTCGMDAAVSTVTSTLNPSFGNTWAEPYPYLTSNTQGYGWPTLNLADKSATYIDPIGGLLVKRVTGPEDQAQDDSGPTSPTSPCVRAYAPSGNWTNPLNGCGVGSLAVSTSTDPLFVALGPVTVAGDGSGYRAQAWDNTNSQAIDDIKLRITGLGATGAANNAGICLSIDGITCWTATKNITLPSSSMAVDYPSGTPAAYFSEWLGSTFQTPPNNPDLARRTGTAKCTGTALQWQTGFSWNMAQYKAGTRIVIGAGGGCTAGVYTIASVTNIFNMTLTGSAGTSATPSTWTTDTFGVLIFPQGEVISIDNVTWMDTQHPQFMDSSSGDQQDCNSNQKTTSLSVAGWICTFSNYSGGSSLYFVPAGTSSTPIGSARMIASQWFPGIADSPAGDGVAFGVLGTTTAGDMTNADNPLKLYFIGANQSRTGEYAVVEGTYDGAAGDYVKFTPPTNTQDQSPYMSWVNLTKHSVGGTLTERQVAFDNRFDPNWNGAPTYIATRSGGYLLVVNEPQQDAYCWLTTINTNTGAIVSMFPSYAAPTLRWSACHSESNAGGGDYVQFSSQAAGNNANGQYTNVVTAINGSGASTLSTTATNLGCSGSDPSMSTFLARGSGCDTITASGPEPCKTSGLTVYELAHFPVCSWNGSYRGLRLASETSGAGQAIALGDTIYDVADGDNTALGEFMMVVGISGNNLIVLRNYSPATGPFLNHRIGVVKTHAAGFTFGMAAGQAGSAVNVFWHFTADTHGTALVNDYTYFPTAHGDQGPVSGSDVGVSVQVSDTYSGIIHAYSVRTGSFATQPATQQNVGSSPNPSAGTGTTFGGVAGCAFGACREDDHPSARASVAPAGERSWWVSSVKYGEFNWFTKAIPLAPATLVGDVADPLTVMPVSGSLYTVSAYSLEGSVNIKYRQLVAWSGRHNLLDISSAATGNQIGTTSSDNWKICYAYKATQCRAGSSAGTLYMNIPSLDTSGTCANNTLLVWDAPVVAETALYNNYPCVAPAAPDVNACTQLNWGHGAYSNGEYARRLIQPFSPWQGTSDFFNCNPLPDGSGVFFVALWANNVRSDVYYVKLPPSPSVPTVSRADYVSIPVAVSAGESGGMDVRLVFGYAEVGGATALHCQAAFECATDTSAPYAFVTSDTAHYTSCTSGCSINLPVAPNHIAYFKVERSDASRGSLRVTADGAEAPSVVVGSGFKGPVTIKGPTVIQ